MEEAYSKDVNSIINFSNKKGYAPKILEAVNDVNENQKNILINYLKDLKVKEMI